MPKARKHQINADTTLYYHCVSRCVRRAFLCGRDSYSGQSYEHRRQWVEERIHHLSTVFCIDVCAYAVMSNHTHVVLRIQPQQAANLTDIEVIDRWHRLFKGTLLTQQFRQGVRLSQTQLSTVKSTLAVWRHHLQDISWFMRALNEYIARMANKEDNCTGRFWEGRFKCQALLGKSALAACLAYVDLNPIRAKMADTPEHSHHTSVQYRINAARSGKTPKYLLAFTGNAPMHGSPGLPFALDEYLQLVDVTGRNIGKTNTGVIDSTLPPILARLKIEQAQWDELSTSFESCFADVVGSEAQMLDYQHRHERQRLRHKNTAKRLFG
jgi:REP element-mobilizing transposase RayT